MVADAKTFGKIAAANALSDIYAMGGQPFYALNILCIPNEMDNNLISEILAGGSEKCKEAGAILAGGHSIYDETVKYGLAVTGKAEINKFLRNNTPKIGDKLILTKPLGVGIITAADRGGEAAPEDAAEAIKSMERLNKYAAEKMSSYTINACTDITGFGLLVHLSEMTSGNVTAEIQHENLPHFKNIKHYIDEEWITGGATRNRTYIGSRVDVSKLPVWTQELMFDPQTSGGLLISVAGDQANELLKQIQTDDPLASIIGHIIYKNESDIIFK